MAFPLLIPLIGLAIAAIGTGVAVKGQMDVAEATQDAEKLRKKQMNLDAMRRRREIARQAILARSQALSNATAQGAGEGSGLQGGYGQISGEAGRATLETNQSQTIGSGIFDANARAAKGEGITAIGGGLRSLGGDIAGSSGRIFGA